METSHTEIVSLSYFFLLRGDTNHYMLPQRRSKDVMTFSKIQPGNNMDNEETLVETIRQERECMYNITLFPKEEQLTQS